MRPSFIEPLESRIAPAVISISPVIIDEGDDGTANNVLHLKVTLDAASTSAVTVVYALLEGTAHQGNQYSPVSGQATGTLTFDPQVTEKTIDVTINGNSVVNSDTNFSVQLSSPSSGSTIAGTGLAGVTIWDDDSVVSFSPESIYQAIDEGNTGTKTLAYSATLSAPAQHAITVAYKTADGTGVNGAISTGPAADFNATSGTLTFAAGSTTPQSFSVGIIGDTLPGPNESFSALLSKPTTNTGAFGVKLGSASATGTINNDDQDNAANALVVSLVGDVNTSEGGIAQFGVKLSRLSESPVTVTYHTADGTAMAGTDYVAQTAGSKTINSALQDTININITASDATIEAAENFTITLDGATANGAALTLGTTKTATATIAADAAPSLKINDVTILENAGGTGATVAVFSVTVGFDDNRDFVTTQAGSFHYETANGTAHGTSDGVGGDFTFTSGNITIPAGRMRTDAPFTIMVPITKDLLAEATENFTVKLSAPVNVALGDDTGLGTIIDTNVALKVGSVSQAEGNTALSSMNFNVVLGQAVPDGYKLLVDVMTADATGATAALHQMDATTHAPQDYVALPTTTLEFAAGTAVKTVAVGVVGDQVLEANETFNLVAGNARLVKLADSSSTNVSLVGADSSGHVTGVGTILNDDGPGVTAGVSVAVTSLKEGSSTSTTRAAFNVDLSSAYSSDVKVGYTVVKKNADGTTTSMPPATLVIPAYAQTGVVNVDFTHADTVGHDQVLTVTINSVTPVTALAGATFLPRSTAKSATVIILEDDAYVKISDATKLEGASGTSLMPFAVQLVDINKNLVTLDHAVSIPFTTVDGTGVGGAISTGAAADFVATANTLIFRAGENAKTIAVPIIGDTLGGVNETFTVQLTAATGANLYTAGGLHIGTGTIVNDDGAAPVLTLLAGTLGVEPLTAGAAGTTAKFTYQIAAASDSPISFDYATSVLTSSPTGADLASQDDFVARTSTASTRITLPSGERAGTFEVTVAADGATAIRNENAEQFGLTFSNITGAGNTAGSTLSAIGTIAASNQPTLSVASVSTVEGDSGMHDVTFTIQLSAATDKAVTFNVQTVGGGTATAGEDYVAVASHAVTIAAGSTSATQTVTINGDTKVGEGDETFFLRVSDVKNATPTSVDAAGTILNDDSAFTIDPTATASEKDEVITFKVTRTNDLALPADVTFKTIDGTAKSNAAFPDFVGGSGTVHFDANAAEATIRIALVDDNRHEATENFSVMLTGATNGKLGSAVLSTATITDNDAVPTIIISAPAAVHETDSGTTAAIFTLTLDHANDESPIVLKVSTADGTAHAGSDYTALVGQTVTIPAGELQATFSVPVINDLTYDSAKTETFKANVILDPANTGAAKAQFAKGVASISGTGSIIDNDVAPQISITAASIQEGSTSGFVAQLNHPSDKDITVKYYTVDGTAKSTGAAKDYTGKSSAAPGTLTFAAGTTTATLNTITTVQDSLVEGNETFRLQLATPKGATLSKAASAAIVTIVDDDHAYLSINDVTISEGNSGTQDAIFTVTLDGDTAAPVTFKYATSSAAAAVGVATAGTDYLAAAGTLTLGGINGAHSAQIKVKVVGDLMKEVNEVFNVNLTDVPVATVLRATGVGTIQDDGDTQATLSINDATVIEGNGTTDTLLHYTATLSEAAPAGGVTFTVKASEMTRVANAARLGLDFLQPKLSTDATKDLTITIPQNSTTATFDVTVKADDTFEPTEFLNVSLTNIVNAQPGRVVGTGTIYDNDLLLTATTAKWTDVDGDLVTLTTSKGNLGNVGFGFTTAAVGTVGGRILQQLNIATGQAGTSFNKANVSITSVQQPDAAGILTGDGRVNVGYIRTNTYDSAPSVLEVTGVDLGTLTVDGDLSRINAGDLFSDPAIKVLNVYSIGVNSATTEAVATGSTFTGPAVSQLLAGAGTINVTHDVSGLIAVSGGVSGKIGSLNIGGALRGTATDDSGRILITGAISKATIHDIIGGAGKRSGSLTQYDSTASLGSLTVTGDLTGGSGSQSGHILFPSIGSIAIGGSMHGGFISAANSLGTVTIGQDMDNGAKIYGGGLLTNLAIKSVTVSGKTNNAEILGGYIANIADAAADQVTKINADAQIDLVRVDGTVTAFDILAGTDPASTAAFSRDDAAAFSRIAQVIFNGDILTNTANHYISAESIGSVAVEGVAKTASLAGMDLGVNTKFLLKFSL